MTRKSGIAETVRSCPVARLSRGSLRGSGHRRQLHRRHRGRRPPQGATVVERQDSDKKSKGYAIEYLIDQLQESGQFDSLTPSS